VFRKVLVANRGEIAVRVIRGLHEMGIQSVAVYSAADRGALHVRMAGQAFPIGPAPSTESYLRTDRILDAARRAGAEAIHPGYGFLSENAAFAQACADAGFVFIGPPPAAIRALGSKLAARRLAVAAGVPVVPGVEHALADAAEARRSAAEIGYPVLLKAAAGGGGKGIRLVESEAGLETAFRDAASEAERAFASAEIYLERALVRPRHIEIQVLGDRDGHLIHLGERECSVQRRHQKVIEECPSPLLSERPELRSQMGAAAVRAARAAGYFSAGTVEFLVDAQGRFYFLEMNTRLQVEHPVTELVTSLDLVHWQVRIAAGEPLTLRQADIAWRGAALECRIYAEDPGNQFFPSPGRIIQLDHPAGPGIRLDSGVYPGWDVPLEYDPLLAKLCVWAEDRPRAIERMRRALAEYHVAGITTNIGFFRRVIDAAEFRAGLLDTGFLGRFLERSRTPGSDDRNRTAVAALAAAMHAARSANSASAPAPPADSRWRAAGRERMLR
jgi:acetyl-CoA carboxylase biotin carboxylase subunit